MSWLTELAYWHWWVLGVVFLILEVFAPGVFFLWLALAAAGVGLLLLLLPGISWEVQFLVYAALSVISIAASRLWFKHYPIETDRPNLNRRGEQYVGRVFTLDQAVTNGHGKSRVDDTSWKIRGEDCDAGSRVRVTGVEGTELTVTCVDR
jgi:hypothetical protein